MELASCKAVSLKNLFQLSVQLRQEFDHGVDVKIDEDYHAHDVAALLKEFFRDLPEALLTRELYPAFISTASMLSY